MNEIIVLVNIALGSDLPSVCTAGDEDGNGEITVDEIIMAVNNALTGCPGAKPPPTPTQTQP